MIVNRKNNYDKEIETLKVIIDGSVKEIYEGYCIINNVVKIIYEAISSCFGLGYWRNEKGWLDQEGWRNNKK
jgi:hypothetical protein